MNHEAIKIYAELTGREAVGLRNEIDLLVGHDRVRPNLGDAVKITYTLDVTGLTTFLAKLKAVRRIMAKSSFVTIERRAIN